MASLNKSRVRQLQDKLAIINKKIANLEDIKSDVDSERQFWDDEEDVEDKERDQQDLDDKIGKLLSDKEKIETQLAKLNKSESSNKEKPMSLAKKLLERHKKLSNVRIKEDGMPASAEAPESEPVKPETDPKVVEAVKWLKEQKWSESNETQGAAAQQMKDLAESMDPEANKFMEYMDEMSCKYNEEGGAPTVEVPAEIKPAGAPIIPEEDDMEDEEDEEEIEIEDDMDDMNDEEEMEDEDDLEEEDDLEMEDEEDEEEMEEEDDLEDDESDMGEDDMEDEEEEDETSEKYKKKMKK